MHPNKIYHTATESENAAFARARAFGVLVVSGEPAPMISHVPFLLSEDGATADLHLVRSNPIIRAMSGKLPARIAVSGPDSYISPDWYGIDDQVPTWNYVAVHLTGSLEQLPQDALPDLLARESAFFEDQLQPKTPWTIAKMADGPRDKLMRMIVPCRFRAERIDGTWKLNQNKPDAVRERAAGYVDGYGIGSEPAILAALMRGASGS